MNATLFQTAPEAKAARRMAEILALGIEIRGGDQHATLAADVRRFADFSTGLTAADITPVTRTRPEARGLTASDGEALGRIDPADAPAFALWLQSRGYAADFLTVQSDGRVTLRSGGVDAVEGLELGEIVADYIHDRTGAADAGMVGVDVVKGFFKPWVLLPSGAKIQTPGVYTTRNDATGAGEKLLKRQRTTVV
jgi:hypothetical protein